MTPPGSEPERVPFTVPEAFLASCMERWADLANFTEIRVACTYVAHGLFEGRAFRGGDADDEQAVWNLIVNMRY